MDREELFLRYLDGELETDGRLAVEKLLAEDSGARERYGALKADRDAVMAVLEELNPEISEEIPAFNRPGPVAFFHRPIFRYAAASVILIGLSLALWLAGRHIRFEEDENQAVVSDQDKLEDALESYISPNRCWNRREIPLIIIEIK